MQEGTSMTKSLAAVCVGAILALLAGCTHEQPKASAPRPPTSPDQVTFYQKTPASKYETLGTVTVPVGGAIRMDERGDATAAFVEMKKQAAAKGANGILLDEDKVPSDVVVTASYNGTFYTVPVNRQPRAAKGEAIWVYEK
jgi:hypothetical protein